MRLVAIYNAWTDAQDLLLKSIENMRPVVDGIIVVYSDYSYYGTLNPFATETIPNDVRLVKFTGTEVDKRNHGIAEAKAMGYTHFIMMDSDEFYRQHDVLVDRNYMDNNPAVNGLVCAIRVLFGKPTLTCNDHTLVPYIHKLRKNTQTGKFREYPYTADADGHYHIDPTRRLNYIDGIQMSNTIMWHASWIRKDVMMKIDNSPAVRNLKKSTILEDLQNARPGYFCQFYRGTLRETENIFNL